MSVAPYEEREEKTRFDYLVQWMFDAEIADGECGECDETTDRLSRVRNVFGEPLCVRCWSERKRSAPVRE